ncbi:MAG: His/Gly/Thr/Pro-type tRNA ligase C-terminal domain-containing protein [Limnochordia bacterium]|nr:His/Gly/Thr/Pro-type tRNA ligase C-terminal domain-containing protein [Limnochordia bacterium]
MNQVPYMLILGEKEQTGNCVSVRHRRQGDLGTMSLTEFIAKLQAELLVPRRSE